MPEINFPEKIIFGKDTINSFHPEGCEHAIVICDSDVMVNRGFLDLITCKITKIISHVSTVVNSNVHALYNEASERFFAQEAQLIISLGTSAVIDCGMLLSHEGKTRFAAIPCCGACGLTDFDSGGYYSYRHSPDTVILDSSLIRCVPSDMIAYDSMACLALAAQALKDADNIITKDLAVSGAAGIIKNIIPAYRGNIDALERLMYAMYFAVVAHRNSDNTESSLLDRASGFFAGFGYPKASVCALISPTVMENEEHNFKCSLYEIAVESGIARPDDMRDYAVDRLTDEIRKMQAMLGIPRAVSGFGLNENEYRNRKSSTSVSDDLLDLCYYGSFKFMKM